MLISIPYLPIFKQVTSSCSIKHVLINKDKYARTTNFAIQKNMNGTKTIIQQVPFTANNLISYTIDFNVQGKSINARVWNTNNGSKPSSGMILITDSSLTLAGNGKVCILTTSSTNAIMQYFQAQAIC